jgi:hypothetical protein
VHEFEVEQCEWVYQLIHTFLFGLSKRIVTADEVALLQFL